MIALFGATGDLGRRKILPAFLALEEAGLMPERYRIIGVGRSDRTAGEMRETARRAVEDDGGTAAGPAWERLRDALDYVSADVASGDGDRVARALDEAATAVDAERRVVYLSVPPDGYGPIVEGLDATGALDDTAVALEKPIGTDLESARRVNDALARAGGEDRVFRVDHFLAKETVLDLLTVRLANPALDALWSREHIARVEIDVPEELALEGRAEFYEGTGALRDMLVTHLTEILTIVALEPPPTMAPEDLRAERLRVLQTVRPVAAEDVVRGQYAGYREAEGVAPDSDTETLAAARVFLDAERWRGVPFLMRSGKAMPATRRAVTLTLRSGSGPFAGVERPPNAIRIEIGSPQRLAMGICARRPGPGHGLEQARLELLGGGTLAADEEGLSAYPRVILDVLRGDRTHFLGREESERAWAAFSDVVAGPPPLEEYAPGTWGPEGVARLAAPGGWALENG